MKIILFSLLLLLVTFFEIEAQNCKMPCPYYNDFIRIAQADTVKNTQTKLNYYRAAIVAAGDCDCPKLEEIAYKQIDTLFILIEADKRRAEAQSKVILEQQDEIEIALIEAEAANKKNMKIINAMDFYDGKFALAFNGEKYGFIDKDGNSKYGFEYDKGAPFDSETGLAEMEITHKRSGRGVEYLVDTLGDKYLSFNIGEESIMLLKENVTKSKKQKKIASESEDTKYTMESINEVVPYNIFAYSRHRLAMNFQGVKQVDLLDVLKPLTTYTHVSERIEILILESDDLSTFPNLLMEFHNLKFLDLYWTNIQKIPATIIFLRKLKTLRLPVSVKEVSWSIYNLENLEILDLSTTAVDTLPETIENLKKLKELKLPSSLVSLPKSIGNLVNLKKLDIANRQNFKEIPDLSKLKKLEHFYLALYKDEHYAVHLASLKTLQEKLPACVFHITNEKGEEINVK
jgi:hypothetical protein